MKDGRERDKSCRGLVNLLCDYVEGDLAAEESEEMDAHMDECPPCLAFLNTYQMTAELCRSLRPEDLPEDLKEKLLQIMKKRETR
jgi:anti-sigma factor (TIGR02949 family)